MLTQLLFISTISLMWAAAAQDAAALKTGKDKISYALGMDLGNQLRRASIQVDPAVFEKGLRDALSGTKTLLTEEEVRKIISDVQAEEKQKQPAAAKPSAEDHAEMEMLGAYNARKGEAFLAANKAKDGVVTLPSGLQYTILQEGKGRKPAQSDTVTCHVRATLLDGTQLEDTYQRRQPKTLQVNRAIKALNEALPLMPAGSKWELFVPPALAYGEAGAGPVPPNSTLIYDVELLGVK